MINESLKEKYGITIVNNLKSSIFIFGLLFTLIAIHIYGLNNYPYYDFEVFLLIIAICLPMLAPPIILHVEYLIINWDVTLEVDKTLEKIKYKNSEKEIEASFDDITHVIKHQVKETALLYGFYEYYEIHLGSGKVLIITILMARNLSIPGIETEIVDCYFPSV